jgi:hypothetical protein
MALMNFTPEQKKIIYDAVRYYQMNRVPHDGKDYRTCDEILNSLFSEVIMKAQPPTPSIGFKTYE